MYTSFFVGFVSFVASSLVTKWWLRKRKERRALREADRIDSMNLMLDHGRVVQENILLKRQLGLPPERRIALYSEGETARSNERSHQRRPSDQTFRAGDSGLFRGYRYAQSLDRKRGLAASGGSFPLMLLMMTGAAILATGMKKKNEEGDDEE